MPVASFVRARRILSILLLLAIVFGGSGQTAQALDRAAKFNEPREAAAHGVRLEQQRKWRDAIQLYKKALKDWPENEHLSYGSAGRSSSSASNAATPTGRFGRSC